MNFWKIRRSYRVVSIISFNAFVIFLLLNLTLGIRNSMRGKFFKEKPIDIPEEYLKGAPDLSHRKERDSKSFLHRRRTEYQQNTLDMRSFEKEDPKKVGQVIEDYYERPQFSFSPYVHYDDSPFSSPTLNVARDQFGFSYRIGHSPKGRYTKKVFMFGGSTTFGVHAADDWTIPFYLQKFLEQYDPSIEVINYGRCGYSWFEEMLLFQSLIQAGHHPMAVVFLDGVNAGRKTIPPSIPKLWEPVEWGMAQSHWPAFFPVLARINTIKDKQMEIHYAREWERHHGIPPEWAGVEASRERTAEELQNSYRNTMTQVRAMAKSFGIDPFFIWQPHRIYKCDFEKYRLSHFPHPGQSRPPSQLVELWKKMETTQFENYYFLGDLCEKYGLEKRVIVDDAHYTRDFNEYIAKTLAEVLERDSKWLDPSLEVRKEG